MGRGVSRTSRGRGVVTRTHDALAAERGPAPISAGAELRLLGRFALLDADGASDRLSTRKAEALLALLALRPGQAQARDKLCALLWPDVRAAQARHSLRQTLLQLRKALPRQPAPLVSDARGLQLTAAELSVDVMRLVRCLAEGTRTSLSEARALYRGELLEGLSVGEAPFDLWVRSERERLRSLMADGLMRLVRLEVEAGCDAEATRACLRLLELDPLREEAQRSLMRLYTQQGRRAAALQHYRSFAGALRAQLGTEPDRLTQQLYAELEGTPEARDTRPAPPTTSGRALELALLRAALAAAAEGQARVTLLAGEAGVGKTHLCDRVVQEADALGFRVLRARCFESEQVLPLALWANLLRDAATPQHPLSPKQRAELSLLVPELAPDEPARPADSRQLFHALRELVASLAAPAPLLLLLEDVHWADEMSARLLSYLGRHQRQVRCLLLLSARDEDLPAASFIRAALGELAREQLLTRVELAPLARAETRELSQQLAEHQALPQLEAALHDQIWARAQ